MYMSYLVCPAMDWCQSQIDLPSMEIPFVSVDFISTKCRCGCGCGSCWCDRVGGACNIILKIDLWSVTRIRLMALLKVQCSLMFVKPAWNWFDSSSGRATVQIDTMTRIPSTVDPIEVCANVVHGRRRISWPQFIAWWRHQMETFSALLVLCAGNSPVIGEFPAQRPVTRGFDVFFHLYLNKRLSKQSCGRWLETPSRSLWRHCNGKPQPSRS